MAEAPVNQSFSEPPPPYAPAEPGKAPYPPSDPYLKPAGPPPAGLAVAPPPAGYTNQPATTIITTQPAQTVTVVRVGNCPRCQTGVMVDDFTCCGICLAICFFPLGILCCLLLKDHRCNSCGYSP